MGPRDGTRRLLEPGGDRRDRAGTGGSSSRQALGSRSCSLTEERTTQNWAGTAGANPRDVLSTETSLRRDITSLQAWSPPNHSGFDPQPRFLSSWILFWLQDKRHLHFKRCLKI